MTRGGNVGGGGSSSSSADEPVDRDEEWAEDDDAEETDDSASNIPSISSWSEYARSTASTAARAFLPASRRPLRGLTSGTA